MHLKSGADQVLVSVLAAPLQTDKSDPCSSICESGLIMLARTANNSCVTTGCVKKAAGISLRSEHKSNLYWCDRQQL